MPDEIKNIKTYRKKERMILSRSIRRRRRYIEVAFGNNDAARLLLSKEKIAYLPGEWLFEREAEVQFSESIVSKKLKEIAHEAGITKRVYPHLFRHSFATHLIEQRTDLKIIKELLGHENIKKQRYTSILQTLTKAKLKVRLTIF